MMDKSGDDRAVTIELPPGTETITPNSANLIADLTSPSHVTIDGHNRVLKVDDPGTLLTVGEGVTLTLRNITLIGNDDNISPLVEVQSRGRVVLGDGVTLTDNKTAGVSGGVWVNGGELVMNDGVVIKRMEILSNNSSSGIKAGGVLISNGGRFNMYGGTIGGENTIDGNKAPLFSSSGSVNIQGSGGVSVLDGSFDMYGGIIQSNSAGNYSFGGVGVFQEGDFTMYRGTIKKNTGGSSGGVGVSSGTFTMNGTEAVIEGNIGQEDTSGGGVWNRGTFVMYAGIIQDNTVSGQGSGGGVNDYGTFTMHDGTIQKNTANGERSGGGVFAGGTFIMKGGTIKKNRALGTWIFYQQESGGGVLVDGVFTMSGGIIGGGYPATDANTAGSVGSGASANGLCVRLGMVTMSGGIITGNTAVGTNNYGVSVVRNISSGTFTMTGAALVTQDNFVFLLPNPYNSNKPRIAITIGGALDNSPAANIIYENPNTPPNSGIPLLDAGSAELISENYDKFLYNGVPDLIDITPVLEPTPVYGGTIWYGVYQ
jgi:hypothetical protein